MRRRALVAGLVAGAALRPARLSAAPVRQLSGRTIVLDPGHGGPDSGARARDGGAVEAFVNLEVALRLRRLLEASGARVIMTRETDARPMAPGAREAPAGERQDLEARVQIANAARADLFVSLHADVLPDPERGGTLVFWGPPSGYTYPRERPGELVRRSTEAAHAVLWHLVAKTGLHERGAAPEAFYVLGSTAMPAILVEMAVLTNPAEGIFLTGEGFQQRLAEGLADGIADYFGERHDAELAADVTVPDGAIVAPGTTLRKVWRVRNSGGAAWGRCPSPARWPPAPRSISGSRCAPRRASEAGSSASGACAPPRGCGSGSRSGCSSCPAGPGRRTPRRRRPAPGTSP
jgi:N-acetylmuramoyl-L-alanine amidase